VQYLISVVLVMTLQDFYIVLFWSAALTVISYMDEGRLDHLLYVNIIARANRIVVFVVVDFSVFTGMHNYT
jgi:hypothetical protein